MENDSGGDSETKEVQMGNYDDADEDHGNDDNYADVNPWVELTYQVQDSLSDSSMNKFNSIDYRESPISSPRMLLSIPSYLELDLY